MSKDGTIVLTAEDGGEDAFFVWEKALDKNMRSDIC